MKKAPLSLSELNASIRESIENRFADTVWVKAEISEYTVNRNGHCYLDLVEADGSGNEVLARSRAIIWSYTFRMLKPYFETTTGQTFSKGIKILVEAKVEFHQVFGLSLNIRDIDPAYTMGDMALRRQEIVLQLRKDGVFDMNRELELPLVPQRIAVISSPTAAGLQDFMNQLVHHQAGFRFDVRLFAATMQGAETAGSVIHALEAVFEESDVFDVVAIIRGGGAQLDLAGFDHYDLAYHVAQFPLPVITGIGHDRDETVVDMVAHTKMKTPTAVAEFLISGMGTFALMLDEMELRCTSLADGRFQKEKERLIKSGDRLKQDVRQLVEQEHHRFELSRLSVQKTTPLYLKQKGTRLLQCSHQLQQKSDSLMRRGQLLLERKVRIFPLITRQVLSENNAHLERIVQTLPVGLRLKTDQQHARLDAAAEKTRLVDPVRVLRRGYSLTFRSGELVRSVGDLHRDDQIVTRFHDGEINSRLTNDPALFNNEIL